MLRRAYQVFCAVSLVLFLLTLAVYLTTWRKPVMICRMADDGGFAIGSFSQTIIWMHTTVYNASHTNLRWTMDPEGPVAGGIQTKWTTTRFWYTYGFAYERRTCRWGIG